MQMYPYEKEYILMCHTWKENIATYLNIHIVPARMKEGNNKIGCDSNFEQNCIKLK